MSDYSNNARVNVYINGQSGTAEIEKLERKMIKLGKEVNRVGKDSPIGKKLQDDMRKTQTEIDKLTKSLDITKMSVRQLESSAKRLKVLRDMAEPGTKEFEKLDGMLRRVNLRIQNVTGGAGKMAAASNKAFKGLGTLGMAYGAIASVAAVGFRKAIIDAKGFSDQIADIQKTTGMTKAEVKELNNELQKIDTRTTAGELREIAIIGGQMGIAKDQMLGFSKAVNIAAVALGDEFSGGAEQVADEMGKLRNIFSDIKTESIEKDILSISNAINVLGAEGMATGPVVADNANRIGGYGIQAGLTTGQVLGLAAAQQELNISSERGSTAIVKIIQKMLTNVEDFAGVAGMKVQEFKTLLDTDLFGAFVKVAEGSKLAGNSNTKLAKIIKDLDVDGAGASEVMAKFGANIDLVKNKADVATQALKSQSSILQEYALKNENAAAAAEKISNAFSKWFEANFVAAAESFLVWLGKSTGLITKLSEKTEDERMQLLLMEVKLKDVNLKQEDRVRIIKELQAKYPDYLGNLDAETVSNEELSAAIAKTNEQLINKIMIMRRDEELQEKAENAAKVSLKRLEAEERLRMKIAEAKDKFGLKLIEGNALAQAESMMQQMINTPKAATSLYQELNNQILELKRLASFEKQSIDLSNEALARKEALIKQLGITMDTSSATQQPEIKPVSEIVSSQGGAATVEEEKQEAKSVVDFKLQQFERYREQYERLQGEIESLRLSEIDNAINAASQKYDSLIEQNKDLQSEMMFIIQTGAEKQKQFASSKMRELIAEELQLNEQRADARFNAEQEMLDKIYDARKKAVDTIERETRTAEDAEINQVETYYAELIALAIQYGVDYTQLVEKREGLIAGIRKKYHDQEQAEIKNRSEEVAGLISDYGNAAMGIISPIVDIVKNSAEKQIAEIEDLTDKRIENLEKQRSKGIITEEQYQKKKLDLEKKTQKEIGEKRRKQAIADRIFSTAQVVFNTAQAVSKSFAESPDTFGLPYSAAAIIMGGLQTAAIWSQDMPQYKKGGVAQGPKHEQGGISLVNSSTGQKVGEMEGGEPYMILSRDTYANNGALIDKLLQASLMEGGRRLTIDELSSVMPRMNMNSAISASAPVMRNGGVFNGSNSYQKAMIRELRSLKAQSNTPVRSYIVLRDLEETQSEINAIRAFANIGSSQIQNQSAVSGRSGRNGKDGLNGRNGSVWFNGSGAPDDLLGSAGDYFLDNDTGNYYEKA